MKAIRIGLMMACLWAVASCQKYEQYEFSGTVIDARYCTLDQRNGGFLVAMDYPEEMGKSVMVNETTYHNVVVLYEPTRHIYVGSKITGKFYLDDRYSRANCSVHYEEGTLPEGVFTEIDKVD